MKILDPKGKIERLKSSKGSIDGKAVVKLGHSMKSQKSRTTFSDDEV
jgi:hypothetical protein